MKIKVDVDIAKIMEIQRRAGDNRTQVYLASEVKRLCDPYVPMQNGPLKNTAIVAGDGSSLTYNQPYAHYQYAGQVLGGRAPKKPTGAALTYSGGGLRGPQWDKRMLADKSEELAQNLKNYVMGG